MRVFLLPVSTRRTLIYCEKLKLGDKPSLTDRAINKANATWTDLEKAEAGWKKRLVTLGNQLFRRIPFEEWGLKSLPPLSKATIDQAGPTKILFPSLFLKEAGVAGLLHKLATERQNLHKSKMIWSVAAMPLTIPVGILPVIPNIPLFYLAFRAYSHYKALSGGRYLQYLLSKNFANPEPSSDLDRLYAAGLLHPTRDESRKAGIPSDEATEATANQKHEGAEETMLLRAWNGKLLAERLQLPDLELEIERAVEQVEKSIVDNRKMEAEKSAAKQSEVESEEEQKRK